VFISGWVLNVSLDLRVQCMAIVGAGTQSVEIKVYCTGQKYNFEFLKLKCNGQGRYTPVLLLIHLNIQVQFCLYFIRPIQYITPTIFRAKLPGAAVPNKKGGKYHLELEYVPAKHKLSVPTNCQSWECLKQLQGTHKPYCTLKWHIFQNLIHK
jgi:hypothetical protein